MAIARFLHIFGSFDLGGTEARTVRLMEAFGEAAQHVLLVADQRAMSARTVLGAGIAATFPTDEARLVSGRPTPLRLYRLARAMQGYDLILSYA